MNTLGQRLHDARKRRGYTQDSLAREIGVSRGVIYNLEKGKTEPQAIVLNAVCQILKIRKDWLVNGAGEMEESAFASQSVKILAQLYEAAQGLSENELLFLLDTVKAFRQRLGK